MVQSLKATSIVAALALFAVAVAVAPAVSQGSTEDTIWQVRGVHRNDEPMEIKALGANGKLHDVVAIQRGDNVHMIDVKAMIDGEERPVKVMVSDERYAPVCAITAEGGTLDLIAITPNGRWLDVKAVRRTGTILHLKAIGISSYFDLHAISPDGKRYDVEGVKLTDQRSEMVVGMAQVHAHVKALPPVDRL